MAPIEIPKIKIEPTKVGKVNVDIPKIPTIKIPEIVVDIKAGSPAMSHYDGVKEDIHIGSVMRNKAGEALVVVQNDHGLLEWRSATPQDVARASLPLITNIQAGSPAAGGIVGSPKGSMAKNEKGEILVVDVVVKPDG